MRETTQGAIHALLRLCVQIVSLLASAVNLQMSMPRILLEVKMVSGQELNLIVLLAEETIKGK